MTLKPFEKWKYSEVEQILGYSRIYHNFTPLNDWLNDAKNVQIPSEILAQAEVLRETLAVDVEDYNEDELKMSFIAPILQIINFRKFNKYRLFTQRKLMATVQLSDGTTAMLGGRVEAMVAMGKQHPNSPYFFVHEYKPLNKTTPSDPLGQLVAAMIVAQKLNNDDKMLYGLYVSGKYWHFVVLNHQGFSESKAYDATESQGIYFILQVLLWTKSYIENIAK